MPGRQGFSTFQWCSQSYYMDRRSGLFTRALGGPWTASTKGWPVYLQDGNRGEDCMVRGCNLHYRR